MTAPNVSSYLPGLLGPVGIQANGVAVTYPRPILNFVGVGFTITDDGTRLNFNLAAGGGSSPSTAETLTNKTFNAVDNTLTVTSGAAGDLLVHNGTKFVRLAKGTALQVLRVNAGATALEWAAAGGGGSSPTGTGLAKVSGSAFVGAASLLLDADVDLAAAIAGSKISPDFSTLTTIVGGLRNTEVSNASTGAINDLALAGTTTQIVFTGAGAVTLSGLTGGAAGRVVTIVNLTGNPLTIPENTLSAAANRFRMAYGASTVMQDGVAVQFVYSSVDSRWHTLVSF